MMFLLYYLLLLFMNMLLHFFMLNCYFCLLSYSFWSLLLLFSRCCFSRRYLFFLFMSICLFHGHILMRMDNFSCRLRSCFFFRSRLCLRCCRLHRRLFWLRFLSFGRFRFGLWSVRFLWFFLFNWLLLLDFLLMNVFLRCRFLDFLLYLSKHQ